MEVFLDQTYVTYARYIEAVIKVDVGIQSIFLFG